MEREITDPASLTPDQMRQILKALPAPLYATDATGRVIFCNEAAVALAGHYPSPDELRRPKHTLLHPDGRPLSQAEHPMNVALGEARATPGAETVIERPDGTRASFIPHATPLFDADGRLIGAVNVMVDISAQKRTEEALQLLNETLEHRIAERTLEVEAAMEQLKRTEREFSLLVGGVVDYALYMIDPTGRVANWNPGAARIKGYTAAEIVGRHFSNFYTPEDREAGLPERGLAAAARDGRYEAEGWRVRKDGSRFLANVVIDAIRNETGELIGFAKITRDITEMAATEAQLRQAQKMEAVGQLTGGVAHDFNNLLAAIIPSIEMARVRVSDERALKYLDVAAHAAQRGATLTHQLLAFSRKQHLASRPVDLAQLTSELCEMLPRTLGPTISVSVDLADDLWPALSDHGQLELALLNLSINARDAMPEGGELTIQARNIPANAAPASGLAAADYVAVSVIDTGCGMSADMQKRVFEPFFTTKDKGRGSGLGLSMVYGFANQSGGAVDIESQPGKGAKVTIFLPRAEADAASAAVDRLEELQAGPRSRILVVDDDAAVRHVTATLVRELGHEAVEADGGEAALAVLAEDRAFDMMIVDLAMPNMHGAMFAVRAREFLPQTPVLFVTGYADVHLPSSADADRVLKKPFTGADLARELHVMLRRREAAN